MRSAEQKISWRNRNVPIGSIIFFVCFYLYVWLFIEPRLIYHIFGTLIAYPAFSVDWGFLKSSLQFPGGVVEYAGGFLSQLYYFSWLGALVITAVAWLMYLAARILVRLLAGQPLKIICYIPAIMLIVIHNRYDSHLTTFLSLLAALWFSVGYAKMAVRPLGARAAVFLVEFYLLYYFASGASFVFAFLATIYEIFVGHHKALKILIPAVAIGTYIVTTYTFDLETNFICLPSLWQLTYRQEVRTTLICIYFFFPLTLFVVGLGGWLYRKRLFDSKSAVHSADKPKMRATHKSSMARNLWQFFQNNKIAWIIETALPIFILTISLFVSFDGTKKKLVQVDYFAHKEMWPEVLKTARQIQPQYYDMCCIHDVDRALYNTGRLGDEMFRYPQDIRALLLSGLEEQCPPGRIFMKRSQLLLKLGDIGYAEKDAFEYTETIGNHPLILERLATIKLAKGQVEAAKVFLKALSKDLIFGNCGRNMLRNLQEDPDLASNNTVQYIRSVASDKENFSNQLDDEYFSDLLDKNSKNKLAFEYMMAFYLLTKQVEKVVANLGRLNDLGYERLPQYYEEAIVSYMAKYKKADQWESMKKALQSQNTKDKFIGSLVSELSGWLPRRETIEHAEKISGLYSFYRGNELYTRKALGPDFADSYFLYYLFNTPRTRR